MGDSRYGMGDSRYRMGDSRGLGEVPEDWRKANVTPIFRKGKKEDPRNYSLTSIPLNVIEQLILETISRSTKDKKVIKTSQHGFTKGKSCLTTLITFCNEKTGLVGEGRAVGIVHLDFCKAFDTVSHKILMEKLMKYGLAEQKVRWTEGNYWRESSEGPLRGSHQHVEISERRVQRRQSQVVVESPSL
ncbi:mitochondrial enolase superfamily member 1 [Grus japonensis]|uniref:Mitochondrial enolase superfamily member 1 n=1 Tax=Grus japonensis TaxID=30415 RepID=A0ABC9WDC4_GRUJA